MSSRIISAQLKRLQGCASDLKRFEISSADLLVTTSYGNGDKHVPVPLIY